MMGRREWYSAGVTWWHNAAGVLVARWETNAGYVTRTFSGVSMGDAARIVADLRRAGVS